MLDELSFKVFKAQEHSLVVSYNSVVSLWRQVREIPFVMFGFFQNHLYHLHKVFMHISEKCLVMFGVFQSHYFILTRIMYISRFYWHRTYFNVMTYCGSSGRHALWRLNEVAFNAWRGIPTVYIPLICNLVDPFQLVPPFQWL